MRLQGGHALKKTRSVQTFEIWAGVGKFDIGSCLLSGGSVTVTLLFHGNFQ
jgi:hypothetical protein